MCDCNCNSDNSLPIGITGAAGAQGLFGGFSGQWVFSTSTSTGPSSTQLRLNSTTYSAVTAIYVSDTNFNSIDYDAFLDSLSNSSSFGYVRIFKIDDQTKFWVGKITAVTDNGTDHTLAVTYILSNSAFSASDNVVLTFSPGALSIWGLGSGTSAIQTTSIGATATGDFSIAAGYQAVASGTAAVAFGLQATASGTASSAYGDQAVASGNGGVAIGSTATASAAQSTAIGAASTASGVGSTALSNSSTASGINSTAIGNTAIARIDNTVQINGASITTKFGSAGNVILYYSANQVTITSEEIDLKTVADATITIPTGSRFFLDSADLILTTLGGTVVTQPTVRLGITGTLALYYAAAITTNLTATLYNREKFTLITSAATAKGTTTLTCGVTSGAAGSSTIKGRFVFKGYLIENQ